MLNVNPNAFTTPVFGPATKASAWANLDLSGVMGATTGLVKLIVTCTSAHTPYVSFRPDGNGGDFDIRSANMHGVAEGLLANGKAVAIEVCAVAGIVEWITDTAAATLTVYLLEWVDSTAVDPTAVGAASVSGYVFPAAAWPGNPIDLSAVSNDDTLFLFEIARTAGTSGFNAAMRASDDADNLLPATVVTATQGGLGAWNHASDAERFAFLLPSGPTGGLQGIRSTLTLTTSFFVHAYIDTAGGWVRSRNVVITDDAPPTSWTDLDLTAAGFSGQVKLILKVKRVSGGGAGTLQRIAFRMNGDTLDYLLTVAGPGASQIVGIDASTAAYVSVTTDAAGLIEWNASSAAYGVDVEVMGWISGTPPPPTPSGARGVCVGAMPLGLTGPYSLSAGLNQAGYLWRDEYRSGYLSTLIGASFVGGPPCDRGVALNGTTQYVRYVNQAPLQVFGLEEQSWVVVFTPDFSVADGGTDHTLFSAEDPVTAGYQIFGVTKIGNAGGNLLRIDVVSSTIDIAPAAYQGQWRQRERNVLLVTVDLAGNTVTYLNGVQVDSTATAETAQGVQNLNVGVAVDLASGFFAGTIHALRLCRGTLAVGDVYPEAA